MNVPILIRELSAFEHAVLTHVCEGKTNAAVARDTNHTEKVVENTVSRAAHAFGIHGSPDVNVRVLLALAYRSYFGDKAFDQFGIECQYTETNESGQRICLRHV
ncbi:MAG: chemotaxis protein CheY [Actinobacteria bacterium]|nr:chemotaxis protein CheY [Actinomycetota bacterium]